MPGPSVSHVGFAAAKEMSEIVVRPLPAVSGPVKPASESPSTTVPPPASVGFVVTDRLPAVSSAPTIAVVPASVGTTRSSGETCSLASSSSPSLTFSTSAAVSPSVLTSNE